MDQSLSPSGLVDVVLPGKQKHLSLSLYIFSFCLISSRFSHRQHFFLFYRIYIIYRCLKLYCECFHTGAFCDPSLCNCKDCHNTSAHNQLEEPRGPRVVATLKLLNKNPEAFSGGGRKVNTKGCRCQKSRYVIEFFQCIAALFCAVVIR